MTSFSEPGAVARARRVRSRDPAITFPRSADGAEFRRTWAGLDHLIEPNGPDTIYVVFTMMSSIPKQY
jgi:hypothetical protein